ncbi:hypothetical protein CMI41_02095 [Candidatus Pacearchaeota archaeon]|nr:hypothetical protein [Candidatus Pacearchaeota archaeon]|tara:strand:- start:1081 stop:1485 length:405 start_codon:yes stop_codon:yes gene_type:complete
MPLCIPRYFWNEEYVSDKDILIRRKSCSIHGTGEDSDVSFGPKVFYATINQRTPESLKRAYISPGEVYLGGFSTTAKRGIFIENFPLPKPFDWKEGLRKWNDVQARLKDCDIRERVMDEFGIEFILTPSQQTLP